MTTYDSNKKQQCKTSQITHNGTSGSTQCPQSTVSDSQRRCLRQNNH